MAGGGAPPRQDQIDAANAGLLNANYQTIYVPPHQNGWEAVLDLIKARLLAIGYPNSVAWNSGRSGYIYQLKRRHIVLCFCLSNKYIYECVLVHFGSEALFPSRLPATPVDRAEVWKAWQIFSKGWEHIRKVYQEEVGPIWDFYIHPRHFFGTHAAIAVGSSAPAISNLANNIRPLGDRHGLLVGCINAIGGDASLPPLWTGDVPTQSSQADDASTSTASAPQGQQPYVPVAIDVNQRYSALRLLATHPTYEGHELYPPGSSTKRPPVALEHSHCAQATIGS